MRDTGGRGLGAMASSFICACLSCTVHNKVYTIEAHNTACGHVVSAECISRLVGWNEPCNISSLRIYYIRPDTLKVNSSLMYGVVHQGLVKRAGASGGMGGMMLTDVHYLHRVNFALNSFTVGERVPNEEYLANLPVA